jgi:uncharacterized protein (TIGR00297 family)
LTASGSVATFLLATFFFGIGGWTWTLPILVFFLGSSLLSKIGESHKTRFNLIFEKSGHRDVGQVLANGGIAAIILILHFFFRSYTNWFIIYLGVLAAVNADTWATEIGLFSKTPPVSIKTFQQVETGTSGGITLLGTAGALLGSLVIALTGMLIYPESLQLTKITFWWIAFAGLFASLVDSLLGATLQAQYQCPICQKVTEKRIHCQQKKTRFISGLQWLNNDWVNAICSFSGFLFVWLGLHIFITNQ